MRANRKRVLRYLKTFQAYVTTMQPEDAPVIIPMMGEFSKFLWGSSRVFTTAELLSRKLKEKIVQGLLIHYPGNPDPLGYALFYPKFHSFSGATSLWLEDLYVREPFRSREVGKAFMFNLAEVCLAEGWDAVEFEVHNTNRKARSFYAKLGVFENNQVTVCRWDEDAMDDYVRAAGISAKA